MLLAQNLSLVFVCLGVLTKIDLMDAGTDALNVLLGKVVACPPLWSRGRETCAVAVQVVPLKLGFVGVINRSQRDIKQSKSVRAGLDHERDFFQNTPPYSSKRSTDDAPEARA